MCRSTIVGSADAGLSQQQTAGQVTLAGMDAQAADTFAGANDAAANAAIVIQQ